MDYERYCLVIHSFSRMTNYPKVFSGFKELSWLNPLFSEN